MSRRLLTGRSFWVAVRNRDWLVNTKRALSATILRFLGPAATGMAGDLPAFPSASPAPVWARPILVNGSF